MRTPSLLLSAVLCSMLLSLLSAAAQGASAAAVNGKPEVSPAAHHDVSAALRDLPAAARPYPAREKPLRLLPRGITSRQPDPVVQTLPGSYVATTAGLNLAGVGNGDYGFVPNAAPPDTNGAVGDTQYVQWVNESLAVFNKSTGALVLGPVAGNTLWKGFGGGCEFNNDGDPVVAYDKVANRWVMTQFSVTTTPYLQCVAVSQTSDATGAYYRYAFTQPNFNDYPKLGVWPDGYYISFNMFSGNSFVGGRACAFERAAMLAGGPAKQICFQLSNLYGGLLPSDLDGSMPPPAGSPNYFVAFGNNSASLDIWKFHADFATPANSTLTQTNIPAPAFSAACSGGGACIPQSGTTQKLDSLADRLMNRLAYRNFGDHESLVTNHSVTAGTSVGVRWYEIRSPGTSAAVYQSGTFAPDASYRWMGSVAMDKVGNIAAGYSVSSTTMHPSIAYSGRAPSDPLGTLQAETPLLTGGGSQTGGLARWGDYSAMSIDPTDDCTFFFTTEYLKSNGSFNWSTLIASFKFPSCTSAYQVLTSISVAPSTASVQVGGSQLFTATARDQFGQPMSSQPPFTWAVSGGGTISGVGLFTASTAGGPFTVTATSGSVSGTASVTVTAAPVLTNISVAPSTASVPVSKTQQFTATGLDQFGTAMAPQPTFNWAVSGGGTITNPGGLFTAGTTTGGPFTVTASSGAVSGTAAVTVTSAPADFSIQVSPSSVSVRHGASAIYSVTIAPTNGFASAVTLSLSGQPSGTTVTFSPNPTTSGSTLSVQTVNSTTRATFPLTITGTSGSLTHTTTTSLTVTK